MIKILSFSVVFLLTLSACKNEETQPLSQDSIEATATAATATATATASKLTSDKIKPEEKEQEKDVDLKAEVKSNYAYIENKTLIIKVDLLKNDDIRYTSWSKPKSVSDKPDMILYKGEAERQGTQGGYHYNFKNGKWDYIVQENPLGDTVSAGTILRLVHNGEEKLYSQMVDLKSDSAKVEVDYKNIYCGNDKLIIKVDTFTNGDRRYSSWNKPKSISDKPDLVINYGQVKNIESFDGYIYEFKNGDWDYIIEENDVEGSDTKAIMLKLLKDGKEQSYTKMSDLDQTSTSTPSLSYEQIAAPIESFNQWLEPGTPQQKVINKLGKPDSISDEIEYDATGLYYQQWKYKSQGVHLSMESEVKGADKTVSSVTISEPSQYKTSRNIGIGSHREELITAYSKHIDPATYKEQQIIAGSMYEGTVFNFVGDKVSEISMGGGAE